METEPGWHGDRYVNEDATLAKGWQEIEGTNYYFTEDTGTVAEEEKTAVASISAAVADDFSETVAVAAQDAVNAQTVVEETVEEAPVEAAEEVEEVVAPVEDAEVVEVPVEDESQIWTEDEVVIAPEVSEDVEEVVQPEDVVVAAPEVTAPEVQEPEVTIPEVEEPEVTVPEVVAPEVEEPEYTAPEVQEPEVEEPEYTAPEVQEPEYTEPEYTEPETTVTNSSLNESIVNAALGLVGVTNGEQCTTVATAALAGAGVDNAVVLWPDQYASAYGYYTDTPEAGNLVYYDNGGRGVDHIAVYIGNGMAVHGNYNGQTVIASVYINGGAPQFIQVVG
jgi:flagellar hook-basal body complex protein FliE